MRNGYQVWAVVAMCVLLGIALRQRQSSATPTPVSAIALPIVCIDPGHPSEINPGATVQNGLREVEVTYDVALALKARLQEEKVARVVMTRDFRGYDAKHPRIVTNRRRAEIANAAPAALFLRLHCDTGPGSGYTVYYPDRAATQHGVTGPSAPMRQASAQAATLLHAGMTEVLDGTLHDNGVKGESATYIGRKQGALTGSIYSKVPALTLEMVFLSNPTDARFIGSRDGRQQMAEALAMGIARYLEARQ